MPSTMMVLEIVVSGTDSAANALLIKIHNDSRVLSVTDISR